VYISIALDALISWE